MAITFPVNPAGQTPVNTFSPTSTPASNSANSLTYTWDGVSWTSSEGGNYVNATGDTMTGPLVVPTVTAQDITTGGNTVVGYQSGLWAPDFQGTSGTSVWIQNGLPSGPSGNYAEDWSSFTWTRIGQTVSVSATLGVKVVGGAADTDNLVLTNLPYRSALGSQLGPNTYRVFSEPCTTSSFAKATTTYTSITALVNNLGGETGIYSGEMIYFLWNSLNLGIVPVQANQISISGQIYFTLQYQTDDTTWTPINGATVS